MKSKVVFSVVAAVSLLGMSCASNNIMAVDSTMQEATLDLGSLPRDQYVIIGQVSGEGIITAKTNLIKKQARMLASAEPTYFDVSVQGDSGRYGFLGSSIDTNMTVLEKAVAIATYKMIQAAQYNGADTVVYVTTVTKILPKSYSAFSKESIVSAKVTGLAVKIKPDSGIKIKIPDPEVSVVKQLEEEKEAAKEAKKEKAQEKKADKTKEKDESTDTAADGKEEATTADPEESAEAAVPDAAATPDEKATSDEATAADETATGAATDDTAAESAVQQ